MRRIFLSLFSLAVLTAGPAPAQTAPTTQPELAQGVRVRVATPEAPAQRRWLVGTVVTAGPDSLVVRPDRADGTVALSRARIEALQVHTGARSRGKSAARYAVIGGLVGASIGAAIGFSDDTEPGEWEIFSREEAALMGATLIGLPSAAVGGVLGWRAGGDEWEDARLPTGPVVSVQPGGGIGLALRLRL